MITNSIEKLCFILIVSLFSVHSEAFTIGELNVDRNGTGTDGWREQGIAPLAELARVRLGAPDFLVLIEVNQNCAESNGINGTDYFSKALNMPYYAYAVEYRIPWTGEDCSTGNAIVSRYPIESTEEIKFNKQCCGFGRPGARNMLVAKISNQNLYIIAAHLESGTSDFPGGIFEGFSVRYQQSSQIAKYVKDNIDLTKNCVVITGDLNMIDMRIPYTPINIPYLGVLSPIKSIGFQDAHHDYEGDKSTVPGTGLSNVLAKLWIPAQLDYILYAGACSIQNPQIWNDPESTGFSDHSLISTDLTLEAL